MAIKTKCVRCAQSFGAPEQSRGASAKCPYCGAENDIVDLSNDDELAALLEDEQQKVTAKPAPAKVAAHKSPAGMAPGVGASRSAAAAKNTTWRQPMAQETAAPRKASDIAFSQMLAIGVGVLGIIEIIVALATGQGFINVLFGALGLGFAGAAWWEESVRKPGDAKKAGSHSAEFWSGAALAIALFLIGTILFLLPAFPVLQKGFSQGFNGQSSGFLTKMFLFWIVTVAYCVGLVVVIFRNRVFTMTAWGYVVACALLLVMSKPLPDVVASLRDSGNPELKVAMAGGEGGQAPESGQATDSAKGSNGNSAGGKGSDGKGPVTSNSAAPAGTNTPESNPNSSSPPPNSTSGGVANTAGSGMAGTSPNANAAENTAGGPDGTMPQPSGQPQPGAMPAEGQPGQPGEGEHPQVQVPWQVAADPSPHPQLKPWVRQPAIVLSSSPNLAMTTTMGPLLAVMTKSQDQSLAQLWDLSTACPKGSIRGSFDFKDSSIVSPDGKYLAGVGDFGAEVWSFDTGKLLARLPLDKHANETLVDFLPDGSVLVIGSTPKGPQCKVWSIAGEPKARKFDLPAGLSADNRAFALSPGKNYVACYSQGNIWIANLQKGDLSGVLQVPKSDDPSANFSVGNLAFSPDGSELVGLFGGSQGSKLVAWAVGNGTVTANYDLSEPITNMGKCRVLECFPNNQGWLVDGRVVVDRSGQAWPIMRHDLRMLGMTDNDHVIVSTDQMLSTWKLTREADGRLKLATLEIQKDELPAGMMSRDSAPQPPTGEALNRASRRYRSQIESDVIAADDSVLLETLMWCPALKQPMLEVRWGVGIQTPTASTASSSTAKVEDGAGAVGTAMVNELQRRIDAGAFGQYPQIGDTRFCTAIFLGSGTRNDLLNMAKAMGLNAVLLIQMPPQQATTGGKRPEDVPKIFVVDMLAKVQLERQVPNSAPNVADVDPDEVAAAAADFGKYLDDNFVLRPMPELQQKDVVNRVRRLTGEGHDDLLDVLAEIRYYQLKGLLSAEETAAAVKTWLGDEKAQAVASGNPPQRRAALEQWVKAAKP